MTEIQSRHSAYQDLILRPHINLLA